MNELLPSLGPKQSRGFIFVSKVDQQDNYFMVIDIEYTSKYHSLLLQRFFGQQEDMDIKNLT